MDVLGVGKLPFMARRNFVNEFIHLLPWSVLAGVVRMRLVTFLTTGFAGRWIRFSLIAASPAVFAGWLHH